ncbi:TrkA C-terminal domain-containing protein [Planctomycetota bacterium]|nr:TrkA C-terminal domain-containing protein [Planctomycetota bacterium]
MLERLIEYLNGVPLAGLMLVVTLGYLLGRVSISGLSLAAAGGTLAVAIYFGWAGFTQAGMYGDVDGGFTLGTFGFALFIYSVGFEAGPQFLSSMRTRRGWSWIWIGMCVVILATLVAIVAGLMAGFDASTTAGVLAGGMTSAPTYAAAAEISPDQAHLSVAFAITYPVGLVGLVFLVQVLPRLFRTDLSKNTVGTHEVTDSSGRTRHIKREGQPELTRAFNVEAVDIIGQPLHRVNLTRRTGCFITRIHRGEEVLIPDAHTELLAGDHLLVLGRLQELNVFEKLVGREVYDQELRDRIPPGRRVIVTRGDAAGKALKDLNLIGRFHCMIQKIERGRQLIEPNADVVLLRQDVVVISGKRENVREAAQLIGKFEASSHQTNIAVYAAGIFLGLLLGQLKFDMFGYTLSPGFAGGLLIAGVFLAAMRTISPFPIYVPRAARQLVRDLGILLFVGELGIDAGHALHAGLSLSVWPVVVAGLAVTIVPTVGAAALGRLIMHDTPAHVWGSICGGMTSSAALAAVKKASDSEEPSISYAAAFAFASIFVTIAGPIVIALMD